MASPARGDRSRERKRPVSAAAVPHAPPLSSLPEASTVRLERQIQDLSLGLSNLASQMQQIVANVSQQQETKKQIESLFLDHQSQLNLLKAQATALPVTPRNPKPIDSPFEKKQAEESFGNVPSSSAEGFPQIVLPDGTKIPLGSGSASSGSGQSGKKIESGGLEVLQKSDKWLPAMPSLDSRNWKTRIEELIGFEGFLETFSSWLGLVNESFGREARFAMTSELPISMADMSEEQKVRASKLFNLLRTVVKDASKARLILMAYQERVGAQERNGFEALRLISKEYLVRSRQEVVHFKNSLLQKTSKNHTVLEAIKHLEFEEFRYKKILNMLPGSISKLGLELQNSDLALLLLKSIPAAAREYVTMHAGSDEYDALKTAAIKYESNQRMWAELAGSTNASYLQGIYEKGRAKGKGKGKKDGGKGNNRNAGDSPSKDGKDKDMTCFRCQRKGHRKDACFAKTDASGKTLSDSPPSSPPNSKKDSNEKGSKKGKDKGKGKGKTRGKINEAVGDVGQPDAETSPKGVAQKPTGSDGSSHSSVTITPLNPFVQRPTFAPSYLESLREFEIEMDAHDSRLHFEDRSFCSDFNFDTSNDVLFSCSDARCVDDVPLDLVGSRLDLLPENSMHAVETCGKENFQQSPTRRAPMWLMPVVPKLSREETSYWWLLDSGASASVVSSECLSDYEVISRRSLPKNHGGGFSSASGEIVYPSALVCLKGCFAMVHMKDAKKIVFRQCLIAAFVAPVPNNVLSLGTLLRRGWDVGNREEELRLFREDFELCIRHFYNTPWIYHEKNGVSVEWMQNNERPSGVVEIDDKTWKSVEKTKEMPDFHDFHKPMIMPAVKRKAESEDHLIDENMSDAEVVRQPFASIDEPKAMGRVGGSDSSFGPLPDPEKSAPSILPENEPNPKDIIADSQVAIPEGLKDPIGEVLNSDSHHEEVVHPAVVKKNKLKQQSLEVHRMQGHQPFNPNCLTCVASKSVTQHRRGPKESKFEIYVDFAYLQGNKYLVIADPRTGMRGICPVSHDQRNTASWIRSWLSEFALLQASSFPLEVLSDAEDSLAVLFKNAEIGREISFSKAAPQGHESVGTAEAAVRAIKEAISSVRKDRQNGVDIITSSMKSWTAIAVYCAMCLNLHSSYQDSKQSPKSLLLGREFKRETTGFLALVLAEIPDSLKKHTVGRFEEALYLRPELNSLGHVCVFLCKGEEKVFVARSVKFLAPLQWKVSLAPSFICKSELEELEDLGEKPEPLKKPGTRIVQPSEIDKVKNVPSSFIAEHGKTDGCNTCSRSSFHGRVHNKICVERYKSWLRSQRDRESPPKRLIGKQGRPAGLVEPGVPVHSRFETSEKPGNSLQPDAQKVIPEELPEVLEFEKDAERELNFEELAAQRNDGDSMYSPSVEEGENNDRDAELPMEVEQNFPEFSAFESTEKAEASEEMELDSLVYAEDSFSRTNMESRHLGSLNSIYFKKDQKIFQEQIEFCGAKAVLQCPAYAISDIDGTYLDVDLAFSGMKTEIQSMTLMEAGRPVKESEALSYCKQHGIRPITCRWVCSLKEPTLVRMRMVAREMAKGQMSARDLMMSSPTSSIESLRLMLSESSYNDLIILALDVSTAFMSSPLGKRLGKEIRVVLKMPAGFVWPDGSPIYLIAFKAINGLRSSGLAWTSYLGEILLTMNIKSSPIESTIYAGALWGSKAKDSWIQIICYVDDLMVFCRNEKRADEVFEFLSKSLRLKETGRIRSSKDGGGRIRFLGRNLERFAGSPGIFLSVDPDYLESTFQSYQILKGTDVPPDLKTILEREDDQAQQPLSDEACLRFRAALGKLSWLSQSLTFLNIYCCLLATGMAQPLDKHERAMRAVLRWMIPMKLVSQAFPSEDMIEEQNNPELNLYTDASWGPMRSLQRRSISGAVYFYRGSMVKSFARIQQHVSLSSCESELSAIADAIQEAVGIQRLGEHMVFGHREETEGKIAALVEEVSKLAPFRRLASFLFSNDIKIAVFTDSQAAIRVLTATGFQRKSRHVEIRICYCQNLIQQGWITIKWIEGEWQLADLYTKCLGHKLFYKHFATLGFRKEVIVEEDSKPKPSSSSQKQLKGKKPESGSLQSLIQEELTRHGGSILLDAKDIRRSDLLLLDQFQLIFLEVCCDEDSCLARAVMLRHPNSLVIRVTEQKPVQNVVDLLKALVLRAKKCQVTTVLHASLPCTGGSPLQFFNKVKSHELIEQRVETFRELLGLLRILVEVIDFWSFELPKRNNYWKAPELHQCFIDQPVIFAAFPRLCQFAVVASCGKAVGKTYMILANYAHVASALARYQNCSCSLPHANLNEVRWGETASYPQSMAEVMVEALRSKLRGGKSSDCYIAKSSEHQLSFREKAIVERGMARA